MNALTKVANQILLEKLCPSPNWRPQLNRSGLGQSMPTDCCPPTDRYKLNGKAVTNKVKPRDSRVVNSQWDI